MTNSCILSIVVSFLAFMAASYAAFYTRSQAIRASETLVSQQQIALGSAVMHFTDRFFDLLRAGEPTKKIDDPNWAYQFWSLHATEFYFFHHGLLPPFMYSLWAIDLAKLYGRNKRYEARNLHVQYLKEYAFHYDAMTSFYSDLFKIAKDYSDSATRNRKVAEYVTFWITQNKVNTLS